MILKPGTVIVGGLQLGPKGMVVISGPQGPKGEPGIQGPAGAQGAVGPKGDTGLQGATGAKGDKGDTGDPGFDTVTVATYSAAIPYFAGATRVRRIYVTADEAFNGGEKCMYEVHPTFGVAMWGLVYNYDK